MVLIWAFQAAFCLNLLPYMSVKRLLVCACVCVSLWGVCTVQMLALQCCVCVCVCVPLTSCNWLSCSHQWNCSAEWLHLNCQITNSKSILSACPCVQMQNFHVLGKISDGLGALLCEMETQWICLNGYSTLSSTMMLYRGEYRHKWQHIDRDQRWAAHEYWCQHVGFVKAAELLLTNVKMWQKTHLCKDCVRPMLCCRVDNCKLLYIFISVLQCSESAAFSSGKCAVHPYLVSDISSLWHTADSATCPGHIWSVQCVIILVHLFILAASLGKCCAAFITPDLICLLVYFLSFVSVFLLSVLLSFSPVHCLPQTHTHANTHVHTQAHLSPAMSGLAWH